MVSPEEEHFMEAAGKTTPNLMFQMIADLNEKMDTLHSSFNSGDHQEQHAYIKTLIAREAKRSQFRDAVIEKTLAGLAWAAMVGIATAVWSYIKDHIK